MPELPCLVSNLLGHYEGAKIGAADPHAAAARRSFNAFSILRFKLASIP